MILSLLFRFAEDGSLQTHFDRAANHSFGLHRRVGSLGHLMSATVGG